MAIKTFTEGEVLRAADLNAALATAPRTGTSFPAHEPGLVFLNTSTRRLYVSTGSQWLPVTQDSEAAVIFPSSAYAGDDARVLLRNGLVTFGGTAARAAANRGIGNSFEKIAEVPSGYRPARTTYGTAYLGNGIMLQVSVTITGDINVRSTGGSQTWNTGATLPLSMIGAYAVAGW